MDKACHPIELLARARALLRRREPSHALPLASGAVGFKGWRFDPRSGGLSGPSGGLAWLSPSEQALMRLFVVHPRELLTREHVVEALFGEGQSNSTRVIDVRVVRLRRALEACEPVGGDLIRTVRGGGYLFSATPDGCFGGGQGASGEIGGLTENRTRVHGFAVRCVTTPPSGRRK